MNKFFVCLFLLMIVPIDSKADLDFCEGNLSQISRDDCFAFEAIIRGLAIPVSYTDIYEIPEEWLNIRTLPWELGLIVLDRSKSRESLMSLAYLNVFQLDGALSEIHTCVTIKKGKMILPLLNVVETKSSNLCLEILENLKFGEPKKLCRDQESIARETKQLIDLINKGINCENDSSK